VFSKLFRRQASLKSQQDSFHLEQEQGFLTIQLLCSRQEHGKQHLLFLEEHLLLLLWTLCSQLQIHSISIIVLSYNNPEVSASGS